MSKKTDSSIENEFRFELARSLDLASIDDLPFDLSAIEVAKFLKVSTSTLGKWRCTGRYNLEFFKTGRWTRYRVSALMEFMGRRLRSQHTGV